MCCCDFGFVCSKCRGTRHESLARPSFACIVDESAGLAELA